MEYSWQLQKPLDAIIFDCDGTLSQLEGIDELAVQNGVGDEVKALTSEAMTATGVTVSLYEKRLTLVKPTRDQVKEMGRHYYNEITPDVEHVIQVLQKLGKQVFIMSAGLKPAVDIFAERLNVPISHVHAVGIEFDSDGNYKDFDRESPLAAPCGKGILIEKLKKQYPSIMHVGDGANDLDAKEHVIRFVGYGGVFYRESIKEQSNFYIESLSLASVLTLPLTEEESRQLSQNDRLLFEKGIAMLEVKNV